MSVDISFMGDSSDIKLAIDCLFGDKAILGGKITVNTVGQSVVYDICNTCGKPVMNNQDIVCKGSLMGERYEHKLCDRKSTPT